MFHRERERERLLQIFPLIGVSINKGAPKMDTLWWTNIAIENGHL